MAPPATEETWAELKRLYIESDESVAGIARQFNVWPSTIFRRAAKEDWPRRSLNREEASRAAKVLIASAESARMARFTLEKRLYQVMVKKLEKLEHRMSAGEELSPADNEREMREIATMVRGFEKVKEAGGADGNSARTGGQIGLGNAGEFTRMRREIAERLERLHRKQKSGDSSGSPG